MTRILLVDDDEGVRPRVAQLLEDLVELGHAGIGHDLETGQAEPGRQCGVADEDLSCFVHREGSPKRSDAVKQQD